MNIRPLFLNNIVPANKTNSMKSNAQTNSIKTQSLKYDTVSFGKNESNIEVATEYIEKLINKNDAEIKRLEAQKKEKIQDTYKLIALRNNLKKDSSDVGVLRALGSIVKENEDGTITISGFKSFSKDLTFSDLGIDKNKVFSRVKNIEEDLYLNSTGIEEQKK